MLISFWPALLLLFGIAIACIALFAFVAKRMKKSGLAGGTIGFFIGFAVSLTLHLTAGSLYVGNGNEKATSYYVFGTPEYKLTSGDQMTIDIPSGRVMVINDSKDTLVLEEMRYGWIFSGDTKWVFPADSLTVEGTRVHYLFKDEPPDEIQTKSDEKEIRWWFRNKR